MELAEEFKKKSKRAVIGFTLSLFIGFGADKIFSLPPILESGRVLKIAGFLLIVLGISIASVAGRTLKVYGRESDIPRGTTNKLVTKGIFSIVRHPAFDGFIMLLFGIAFLFNSLGFLIVSVLDSAYIIYFALKVEEMENAERFGEDYLKYRERVPAFIPKFWKFFS